MKRDDTDSDTPGPRRFETTRWKVVQEAGKGSKEALTTLCGIYWQPIYTFYRRTSDREEAQDLTQGFFAHLLDDAEGRVGSADANLGKFRNWLLAGARNHRADEKKRARAQKRGGGGAHLSIDAASAEEQYRMEPTQGLTPEQSFERRWALTVLDRVFRRLGNEHEASGKTALFEKLKRCIVGENERLYRDLAKEAGMTEDNFAQQVRRCKLRYRELLGREVADTMSTSNDVEEELRFLQEAVQTR